MVARADLEVTLKAIDRASPTVKQLESSIIRFVGAVSASIAALAAITFPIVQATKFDRAMRDVQKTTGFADAEIRQLGKDLLQLSTGLDQSATSLAGIAAAAGQLGLGRQGTAAILSFTESVARAATTLDLSTDAAARASAKLVNIFNLDIGQVENLFSSINALSNTTTANAGELIDTMARIGSTANLTAQEVAALSATSVDLGVSAEVAGTSLLKVFSRIQSNAQGFADAIGVSLTSFTALPALDRFRLFLEFLSTQTDEVQANLITTLAGGGRIFGLVNKLLGDASNEFTIFNRNLKTAEDNFETGQSAIEEYANISKALEVQLNILRNNFAALTTNIGQAFIPRLLELTTELKNFLQSDEAKIFFRQVGEAAQGFFELLVRGVRIVANLDIEFQNLLAVLKAIIALQFARIVGGIASRLLLTVTSLGGLAKASSVLNGPLATTIGLFFRSRRAGATFAQALQVVVTVIRGAVIPGLVAAGEAFVAFFPIIAIGVAAAVAIFLIFEDQIKETFNELLDFFGFVNEEQADTLAKAKKSLQEDIDALEESTSRILAAEQLLAQSGSQLPDKSFAEIIEDDILELNDALLIAQKRIEQLGIIATQAARKSNALANAIVRFEEGFKKSIQDAGDAQTELAEAEERLKEARAIERQTTTTFDPADRGGKQLVSERGRAAILEEVKEAEEAVSRAKAKQLELTQKAADLSNLIRLREKERLELAEKQVKATDEAVKLFIQIAGTLSDDLRRALVLEIDAREAENQVKTITEELGVLRGTAENAQAAIAGGGGLPAQQAFAAVARKIEDAKKRLEEATAAAKDTRSAADAVAKSALNAGEQLAFDKALKTLPANSEALQTIKNQIEALPPAAKDAGDALEQAFVNSVVATLKQKEALEQLKVTQKEAVEEAESVAKAAESVFNNTATEVRAFVRNVITSVEQFRVALDRRPLTLRFEARQAEIREGIEEIVDARTKVEDELADLEEKSSQTRLLGAFTFEKNKAKAALAEFDRLQRQLEDRERANNQRRLEAEFAAIQNRTAELLARAQQAAESGNLSEALGLKELAKTQIPELFNTLNELSGLTTGEGQPLVSTANLEALLDQVQSISGQVQKEIPGINETLRDSTEATFKRLDAQLTATTDALKKIDDRLAAFGASVAGFSGAINTIIKNLGAINFAQAGGRGPGGIAPGPSRSLEAQQRDAVLGPIGEQAQAEADARRQGTTEIIKLREATLTSASETAKNTAQSEKVAQALAGRGLASGGLVRGRGTGTSDSIMARLSNGEFVMNAATTKFFGSSFFQGLQNFARGGFAVPSFAGGGFVGNSVLQQAGGPPGSPVNITMPGGERLRLATGVSTVEDIKRVFSREARKAGRRLR